MAPVSEIVNESLLTHHPAWKELEAHFTEIRDQHLRDLFATDPQRGSRMTLEGTGIYLDYSKNRITDRTLQLLLELAKEIGLQTRIDAMFNGEKINSTEKRAVLHIALRKPRGTSIRVDGKDVVPDVHDVLGRMTEFCQHVRERGLERPYR